MNNLQNHCDIFYTLVLPLKLQSINDVYLRTICLSKEKKQKNQDFIKSLNKNFIPHKMLIFLPNYASPVSNLEGKKNKQRNLLPKQFYKPLYLRCNGEKIKQSEFQLRF